MMRVAIAGTGGLARIIATNIRIHTGHPLIFLSRSVRRLLPLIIQIADDPVEFNPDSKWLPSRRRRLR